MLRFALLLVSFSMLSAEPRCLQNNHTRTRSRTRAQLDEFKVYPVVCVGQIMSMTFAPKFTQITLSKSKNNEAYFTKHLKLREILIDAYINRDWLEIATRDCYDGGEHEFERIYVFKANKESMSRSNRKNTFEHVHP